MSQDIITDITNFQQKKDDVLKNVGLLNNLSEKLTIAIQEEERKVHDNKIKDVIESKKTQTDNELELLSLENKKMEGYLEILARKQELELKYIEQLCEQKSRVEKVGEKYPHIELREFWSYDDYYTKQLQTTAEKSRKKKKQHATTQPEKTESEDDYTQRLYQHYLEQHKQMQQMQQYIQQQQQCIQQQHSHLTHQSKKKHNVLSDDLIDSAIETQTEATTKKKSHTTIPPPPPNITLTQIESSSSSVSKDDITEKKSDVPTFMSVAPLFPLASQLKNPNNMKMLKKVDSFDEKQRPRSRRESLHDQFSAALDTKFANTRNSGVDSGDSESDISE